MISRMTDDIAFTLGRLDFKTFYSAVLWKLNKEPFELANFFKWRMGMGYPCIKNGDEYITDWENISIYGYLKIEEIKTISQKLSYIRGRLQSYSVEITPGSISIGYANSYDLRDFLAQCIEDVIRDKWLYNKTISKDTHIPKYVIVKSESIGTIPGTPNVTITGDKEVIDYILGK